MLNSEFHILLLLNYYKDDKMTVSQIAEKLNVPIPSISRSIKAMEEKAWIKRYSNPEDRRTTYVEITSQGTDKYRLVKKEVNSSITRVLSKYDPEEIKDFIDLGNRLSDDFLALYQENLNKDEEDK